MYLFGGMVAVLTGGSSPALGIAAALGAAILVGLVQGGLIAGFRLNSMPVTLGGYLVVLGITYILGHNKSVLYDNFDVGLRLDEPVLQIFSIRSLVSLGIFVVAALVLRYLRVGRDLRAIGGDRRAARVAGVRVDRLLIGVFVVSALGAALPGALLSYSLATASPTNIGFDVLTFSATAALIGGVSLSGGKGGAVGIAAGVLSLSVLQEILAILRSPDYVSSLITGGLLVVVTIVWAPTSRSGSGPRASFARRRSGRDRPGADPARPRPARAVLPLPGVQGRRPRDRVGPGRARRARGDRRRRGLRRPGRADVS
jgi:ribose/xylose/arabinose/galactoside ABC-type transport system permease subunit